MAEQDSRSNLGAWLAFFGVLITAVVTLYLGLRGPSAKPNPAPMQRGPVESRLSDPVLGQKVGTTNSSFGEGATRSASADLCALRGTWTIINFAQNASWPAHFSDGMLIVEASFGNNTHGRFKYRCSAHDGGIALNSAGSEAYGQEMPFSFNFFDGEYTRESEHTFTGKTADGEKLLLALQ